LSEPRINFPFSAIVGQERLKLALLLNAVNPSIGGLLVRGPKGSGKSVGVRALEDLLPEIEVSADCPFNCSTRDPSNMCSSCRSRWDKRENIPSKRKKMKVITLPLGSTEDRVVGTLDMEKALREGVKALQPGILAEANQNILYVDEINLLPDHIVDDLLDAAASGWNVVEREAISVAHPSRLILVGTMNPEEGELRPQLLDRLPISATLSTIHDVDKRVEIVKRNLEFRRDPSAFTEKYSSEQKKLSDKILKAKELLEKVRIPDSIIYLASSICVDLEVDGQRPDIIMAEAARTIAALDGRIEIMPQDVLDAAKLALNHRTRKGGFEGPPAEKQVEEAYERALRVYRGAKFKTSEGKTGGEPLQTPPQAKLAEKSSAEPVLESKPKTEEDRSVAKMKEGESVDGSRKEGEYGKVSKFQAASLRDKVKGFFARKSEKGSPPGRKRFFRGIQKELPRIFQELRSSESKVSKGKRFISGILIEFSRLRRRIRSSKSQLFEGVPLGDKMKNWIDNRFRLLPDMKVKGSRRSFFAGKRGISLTTLTRGRYRFYEKPPKPRGDVALFPTIQAAATSGHINREGTPFVAVQPDDVRTKIRVYKAPVTVVLVLDVSGSMADCLDILAKAVSILNKEAYRKRDRLALIAFKGNSAHVLNDPTTNINVVAGNIRRLKASWSTPLADGMMKALEVVKNEKRRNRDVIPLVVIISDFLPNIPLKMPGHSDGTADTLYVAQLLRKNSIPVLVIDTYRKHVEIWKTLPTPLPREDTPLYWGGSTLAKEIARITGGRYYKFSESLRGPKLEEIISEAVYEVNYFATSPLSTRVF